MGAHLDHAITRGTFCLDGQTHDVENNVWVLGDNKECVVIDAPHDIDTILELIGTRHLRAILCTHAHDDHVTVAPELGDRLDSPIYLHRDDMEVWALSQPDHKPDGELKDGQVIRVAGIDVAVIHTPGHSPGSVCFYVPAINVLFSGDTLFAGGPGATGRSFSDFPTIIESIRDRLLTLPEYTEVRPGHGDSTTIGDEAPHLQQWISRGF